MREQRTSSAMPPMSGEHGLSPAERSLRAPISVGGEKRLFYTLKRPVARGGRGPGAPGGQPSRCGAQAAGSSPRRGEMLDRRRGCLVTSGAHLGSWGLGEGRWVAWL